MTLYNKFIKKIKSFVKTDFIYDNNYVEQINKFRVGLENVYEINLTDKIINILILVDVNTNKYYEKKKETNKSNRKEIKNQMKNNMKTINSYIANIHNMKNMITTNCVYEFFIKLFKDCKV
jgi:hypothetical protein